MRNLAKPKDEPADPSALRHRISECFHGPRRLNGMINSRMIGGFILVTALAACSGKAPTKKEMPHLAKLRPANEYFRINPAEKNILRAEKGSQFTIEADSFVLPKQFNNQDRIEVLLIEATKSLEFAALPVSLEFRDKERDTLFESAGMFFVGAQYDGAPLKLRPGKKNKSEISHRRLWGQILRLQLRCTEGLAKTRPQPRGDATAGADGAEESCKSGIL